jgi:hypothetical protein
MFRRIAVVALCTGLLGGGAATAQAAVKIQAGLYTGLTEQDAEVSLRVAANKKSVFRYSFEGAVLECSDGQARQLEGTSTGSTKFKLNRQRKFGFQGTHPSGAALVKVNGKIGAKGRASGTLRMQALVDETNSLNPEGTIVCDTGRLRWLALR